MYIGSHSGDFAALRIADGSELWKVNLSRVVGSPSVVGNGQFVVIGQSLVFRRGCGTLLKDGKLL